MATHSDLWERLAKARAQAREREPQTNIRKVSKFLNENSKIGKPILVLYNKVRNTNINLFSHNVVDVKEYGNGFMVIGRKNKSMTWYPKKSYEKVLPNN